ncbi:MAG: hypothetical protein Tsb0034_01650 [Ekhidna sp.]
MRHSFLLLVCITFSLSAQDAYDKAREYYNQNQLDSARYFINQCLTRKPTAEDYFLSGMIHEAEDMSLRALADYEAVVKKDPDHLEAYFQKGLIYYNSASTEQAVKDFTKAIENHSKSETKAIYYGNDPHGAKGTFLTTLQSMLGRLYQYRGMAYQRLGENSLALDDFNKAFEYDTLADFYINRSQLHANMSEEEAAIADLKKALELEPESYLAWYNLAILDETALLPSELISNASFSPILNLMGANAYESESYARSAQFYTSSLKNNPEDDLALIGRGKALLRTGAYQQARADFLKALQVNPSRTEAFYVIGNSLFYEKKYEEALGFYDQYLSLDQGYGNVWYNAAMSYLSLKNQEKGCYCLNKAADLGMEAAMTMQEKHCGTQ